MKSLNYLFVFVLLGLCGVYAQEGKVGVNTTNPKTTLDVEGNLRIGRIDETTGAPTNCFLTTDADGVVKTVKTSNLGVIGTTKVSSVGIRTKISGSNPGNIHKTVIYDSDKVSTDVDELSYDGNTGRFTVNKEGYYFINVFHKLLVAGDANGSAGTADTVRPLHEKTHLNICISAYYLVYLG